MLSVNIGLAIAFILFFSLSECASNANPATVFSCNATATNWGCRTEEYKLKEVTRDGIKVMVPDRRKCLTVPTPLMFWATNTVRTDKYLLFAGEEDSPQTSYVPGSIIDITILVTLYQAKYRGLMLYAEDSNQNHVGEWKIDKDFPAFFQLPWGENNTMCRQTVMHSSAVLKPLRSTLSFIAPPKGTGTIWFRALIKSGDANTGDFWWPNLDQDFSMTESSDSLPTQTGWFQTEIGQSCNERCDMENLKCDLVSMERINSINRINEELKTSGFICKKPYLSGCSAMGASQGADGFCYFDDTRCDAQGRAVDRVTCEANSTSPEDGHRFCRCLTATQAPVAPEDTIVPTTASPTPFSLPPLPEDTQSGSSTRPVVSILLMFLCALGVSFFKGGRSSTPLLLVVLVIAMIAFPTGIQGHNWMESLSRRSYASTETPCPQKIQDGPHVQVGKGQYFELEWAAGHRDYSYFVIVHEKYEEKLKLHTKALIQQYFEEAPANKISTIPVYHRQFRTRDPNPEGDALVNAEIKQTSSSFIPRPEAFGTWHETARLFKYKSQYHQDNYAEYENPDMPWIEGILKAEHLNDRGADADMAKIKIPGRAGFGRYIVHWLWRGYRDCTDVDYVNKQVGNIYGEKEVQPTFTRVDHCYFPNYNRAYACSRIFNDLSYCARSCTPGGSCAGIAVMPLTVANSRYIDHAGLIEPSCFDHLNISALTEPADEVYVCFNVVAREPSDTFGVSEIVYEDDPAYHATCYMKSSGRTFPGYVAPTEKSIPWRHGEKCVDCHTINKNRELSLYKIPKWPLTDDCINCDLEPKMVEPDNIPKLTEPQLNVSCDGVRNWWNGGSNNKHHNCTEETKKTCHKQLRINGRKEDQVFESECAMLASMDPECTDKITTVRGWMTFGDIRTVYCYCQTTQACCRGCKPVARTNYRHYTLSTSA